MKAKDKTAFYDEVKKHRLDRAFIMGKYTRNR